MDKLENLAAKNPPSNWKEKVIYRKENKAWLKQSSRISLRILDALDDKGWNKTDLAQALGITPELVNKYVKGECDFNLSTISQLEKALGVELMPISIAQ